jgi:hypothetical protein
VFSKSEKEKSVLPKKMSLNLQFEKLHNEKLADRISELKNAQLENLHFEKLLFFKFT